MIRNKSAEISFKDRKRFLCNNLLLSTSPSEYHATVDLDCGLHPAGRKWFPTAMHIF